MTVIKGDITLMPYSANNNSNPYLCWETPKPLFLRLQKWFLRCDLLTPSGFFIEHFSKREVCTFYPGGSQWVWNLWSCSFLHWKSRNCKHFGKQSLWQAEDVTIPRCTKWHCLTPTKHFSQGQRGHNCHPCKFEHSALKIHWIKIHHLSWKWKCYI